MTGHDAEIPRGGFEHRLKAGLAVLGHMYSPFLGFAGGKGYGNPVYREGASVPKRKPDEEKWTGPKTGPVERPR